MHLEIPTHIMLAEDVGPWLFELLLFLGTAVTSMLALGSLLPAWRGMRWLTFGLIAPAILIVILTTSHLANTCRGRTGHHDPEEIRLNYVEPWLFMAMPPFAISTLSLSLLVWRSKSKTSKANELLHTNTP